MTTKPTPGPTPTNAARTYTPAMTNRPGWVVFDGLKRLAFVRDEADAKSLTALPLLIAACKAALIVLLEMESDGCGGHDSPWPEDQLRTALKAAGELE